MARADRIGERGLALLELLVALTLTGLLLAMLHQGFTLGRRVWERAETASGARLEAVEAAQGLLREQLRLAYPARPTGIVAFQGGPARLEYLTAASPLMNQGGRVRASLSLTRAGTLELAWLPETEKRRAAVPRRVVVLSGVAALEFGYFGPPEEGLPPRWFPRWENQPNPPRLVRVRLAFAAGDPRPWPELLVAPLLDQDAECLPNPQTFRCEGRS
jgi:general secretion pathway protein J